MAKFLILSNVTIAVPFFLSKLKASNINEILVSEGYNTWRQALINPTLNDNIQGIFLIMDGRAYLEEVGLQNESILREAIDRDLSIIKNLIATHPNIPFFVSDLDVPQFFIRTATQQSPEAFTSRVWRKGLEDMGIPILELANMVSNIGRDKFYSKAGWYSGMAPFSVSGQQHLADAVAGLWNAYANARKKVLILDLDNTLWGGVIGEDGINGIQLGEEGSGRAYRDFQRRLKEIKDKGILLAIVSKNNPEDAMHPITEHPAMLLREEDFVSIQANWLPKSQNITELSANLNLGMDSFVFVDDNPVERAAARLALPELNVPDFPDHPAKLDDFAQNLYKKYFFALHFTREDGDKTREYQAESKRRKARLNYVDLSEFLSSLNMQLICSNIEIADCRRVAQMTQKTNQFNLTTRRRTESDIMHLLEDPSYHLFKATLSDNYGDFGIIAMCIVHLENRLAEVDTFLMSCRAMGRGVENLFLKSIENQLHERGAREIVGVYLPTPKNKAVSDFYSKQNYAPKGEYCWSKTMLKSVISNSIIKLTENYI